jgi:hypothetical protein
MTVENGTAESGTAQNDLGELKQHVVVHARGQNLKPKEYHRILDRIQHDGDGPGSWVAEWSSAAAELERAGRLLDASRHYAMARFPFVNGEPRRIAHEKSVAAFDRWRADVPGIERLDVKLPGGTVRGWTSGLSAAEPRPLLLVMGGIVTVKEQWGAVLAKGGGLGLAGVVTELPGVGENTLPYDEQSPAMVSAILDALDGRADVSRSYALAMSFSGHLVLRAAAADPRLRGVVTTGAPLRGFFTDADWQRGVPRITTDTLAHLTGTDPDGVYERLRAWALEPALIQDLDLPIRYAVSRRDEIIPPGEPAFLRRYGRDVALIEKDDVHGSPAYSGEIALWSLLEILAIAGGPAPARAVLSASLLGTRLRRLLPAALR